MFSSEDRTFVRQAFKSEGVTERVIALLGNLNQIGKVFYCDPTDGDDANGGLRPDQAKATMDAAIGLCTADRGDVIIRMQGTETVSSAVEFDVAGITVIAEGYGLSPESKGEYFATQAASGYTDGPAARITARCTLIGLGFVSRDSGTVAQNRGAALTIGSSSSGAFGVHLLGCRFPKWGLDNRYGVYLDGTNAITDCTIEACTFEGVGSDFDYGILLNGAIQNPNIVRNKFRDCTYAVGYNAFAGGGPDALIASNWVLTANGLLDSNSQDAPTLVADNWLGVATGTGAFDVSIATLDGNNIFVADNHYKES